jgi:acetyltransferase-like isoleucine patch superfamily enzyme
MGLISGYHLGERQPNEPCGAFFINYETGVKPEIASGSYIDGVVDCIHKITVEKDVFTGHAIMLLTGSHDYTRFGDERKATGGGGSIYIEEGAWIASGAIVCGPCRIGKHSVIGAGSVLVGKDIPPYQLWAGNPCHFIKEIPHENCT